MNYLVHLFVSNNDPMLQVGNWAGDMIRNKDLSSLPDQIRNGVFLHRSIDSFSDNHPLIKQGIERIRKHQGKYAPVVLDVYFDHILFLNWEKFSTEPFPAFSGRFYQRLEKHADSFPENIRSRARSMAMYDFLNAYTELEGMRDVFKRIAQRARFPNRMEVALENLLENWEGFNADFLDFFPDLQTFVDQKMKEGY